MSVLFLYLSAPLTLFQPLKFSFSHLLRVHTYRVSLSICLLSPEAYQCFVEPNSTTFFLCLFPSLTAFFLASSLSLSLHSLPNSALATIYRVCAKPSSLSIFSLVILRLHCPSLPFPLATINLAAKTFHFVVVNANAVAAASSSHCCCYCCCCCCGSGTVAGGMRSLLWFCHSMSI